MRHEQSFVSGMEGDIDACPSTAAFATWQALFIRSGTARPGWRV